MYKPGWIGTWMVWFINQHSKFPQYNLELNYGDRHDPTLPTDFICRGGSWFEREGHSFKHSQNSASELASIVNVEATHRCYKTFPHDYPDDSIEVNTFVENIKKEVSEYHVIIPYAKNEHHIKILARRFVDIIELDEDEEAPSLNQIMNEFSEMAKNKNYYSKVQSVAKSVYLLDVGELMFGPDHIKEQIYLELLNYINDKPIELWKNHIEYAVNTVFKRYMDNV